MSYSPSYVARMVSHMKGVESAEVTDYGTVQVVIAGGINRALREDILSIGKDTFIPIQVFYRMPDGRAIGEETKDHKRVEWIDDFYAPLHVPGFLGTNSEAPPEEVSKDPKGALKLRRVRASTRGKPVVAWRYGSSEVRAGSKIKFDKEAALQWTMGRTLSVRSGASAHVNELSSRRPIAFIRIGDYDNVELPIHMLGHFFSVMPNDAKKESLGEAKKTKAKDIVDLSPEFGRIMNAVGIGWGRDPAKDNVPVNQPFDHDQWIARSKDVIDDDVELEEDEFTFEEAKELADDDDMLIRKPRPEKVALKHGKPVIVGKKF